MTAVETRVVRDVIVLLDEEPAPIARRAVSLPSGGPPALDRLQLTAGRLPAPGSAREIVLAEQFAQAHALGDRLPLVLNGALRELEIVGAALSPEYVLAVGRGEGPADGRRFAVV